MVLPVEANADGRRAYWPSQLAVPGKPEILGLRLEVEGLVPERVQAPNTLLDLPLLSWIAKRLEIGTSEDRAFNYYMVVGRTGLLITK